MYIGENWFNCFKQLVWIALLACSLLNVSICNAETVKAMNEACRSEIKRDNFEVAEVLCKASLHAAEDAGTDLYELPSVFRLPTGGVHATCFSIC